MAIERFSLNRKLDGRATFLACRVARPGTVLRTVVLLLSFAAILGAGVYGATQLMALGGNSTGPAFSTYTVEPGEILVTVTEDGNVESASQCVARDVRDQSVTDGHVDQDLLGRSIRQGRFWIIPNRITPFYLMAGLTIMAPPYPIITIPTQCIISFWGPLYPLML